MVLFEPNLLFILMRFGQEVANAIDDETMYPEQQRIIGRIARKYEKEIGGFYTTKGVKKI